MMAIKIFFIVFIFKLIKLIRLDKSKTGGKTIKKRGLYVVFAFRGIAKRLSAIYK